MTIKRNMLLAKSKVLSNDNLLENYYDEIGKNNLYISFNFYI